MNRSLGSSQAAATDRQHRHLAQEYHSRLHQKLARGQRAGRCFQATLSMPCPRDQSRNK